MMTPLVLALSAAFSAAVLAGGTPADRTPNDPSAEVATPGQPAAAPSLAEEAAGSAHAARPMQAESGRWEILVAPYAWAPTIHSKTAAGKLELSTSDIVEDLDAIWMGAVSAQKVGSPWGFALDTLFFALSDDPVELQATVVTPKVTYKLYEDRPHKLTVGVRYWDVDVTAGPLGAAVYWLDGVVGGSTAHRFNEKFGFTLKGDVGGAGIGNSARLTWQTMGAFAYQLNDAVIFALGYRYLYVDQESKTKFDSDIYGPIIGARIRL